LPGLAQVHGALHVQVGQVLRLERAQSLRVKLFLVVMGGHMHAFLRGGAGHAVVELVRVAQRCLELQRLEPLLLLVVIASALHIVLVLLQQPQLPTLAQLAALLVLAPLHHVAQRRHVAVRGVDRGMAGEDRMDFVYDTFEYVCHILV